MTVNRYLPIHIVCLGFQALGIVILIVGIIGSGVLAYTPFSNPYGSDAPQALLTFQINVTTYLFSAIVLGLSL